MNFNLPSGMAPIGIIVLIAFWIVTIIINFCFAIAVHRDAVSLNNKGTGTVFTSPFVWSLSVLIGGVFLATIYWVIHHSAFRRTEPISGNPGPYMWQPPYGSQYYGEKLEKTSLNDKPCLNDEPSFNDILK